MELLDGKIPLIKSQKKYKLSDKEFTKLFKAYSNIQTMNYLCKIKGKIYHNKRIFKEDVINELLGKIISEYFGDQCINSQIIRDEFNRYYLLTENFIKIGNNYNTFNSGIFPNIKLDESNKLELFNLDLLDVIKSDTNIRSTD